MIVRSLVFGLDALLVRLEHIQEFSQEEELSVMLASSPVVPETPGSRQP
jgi:hypothetical protein